MSAPHEGQRPDQPGAYPAQPGPTPPPGQPYSSPLGPGAPGAAGPTLHAPHPGQAGRAGQPGQPGQEGWAGQPGIPGQPGFPGQPSQPGAAAFAGQAPGVPPRKSWFARHKILTGLGVIVILAVIGAALGGGGGDEPEAPAPVAGSSASQDPAEPAPEAPDEEPDPEPAAAVVGTPVRDGKFEFTVTSVETGVPTVGDEFLNAQAQGQFVLVHVTVTNIGDQAQMFDGSSQKLVDTAGREHSADTSAAIYLGDANSFLTDINPGNSVEGTVVFDVPADAVPASVTLHDSFFSGGVEVSLG